MSEELRNYRAQQALPEFDQSAFVQVAREAREWAKENGDVLVAWTPERIVPARFCRSWTAKYLDEYQRSPFVVEITHDDKLHLWTDYFGHWSSELIDAIFAVPGDADPPTLYDPIPVPGSMHQPVPIPVPELEWEKKQQSEQELRESNRKSREEIKRILGQ